MQWRKPYSRTGASAMKNRPSSASSRSSSQSYRQSAHPANAPLGLQHMQASGLHLAVGGVDITAGFRRTRQQG